MFFLDGFGHLCPPMYNEDKWRADLETFKAPGPTIAAMMQQMVTPSLALLGDLYITRRVAIHG